MADTWQFQIRLRLADALARTARRDPSAPELAPLPEILARHDAALVCQFDAFAAYVAEAERQGTDAFPLYAWTKATIEDPVKKAKHLRSFTLHVDGAEVYSRAIRRCAGGGAQAPRGRPGRGRALAPRHQPREQPPGPETLPLLRTAVRCAHNPPPAP